MSTSYNNNTTRSIAEIMTKFKELFDGTLFTWKKDPVYFELKANVRPICSRLYPVPKVHEEMFKKEVENLVLLGVLEVVNDSEWGTPSFTQPKPKSNIVSYLSDFSNLNK